MSIFIIIFIVGLLVTGCHVLIDKSLESRKRKSIGAPVVNDPFETNIPVFQNKNPWPAWKKKRENIFYANKIDAYQYVRDEERARREGSNWNEKREKRRDCKLYDRMVKVHNNTDDLQARAAVVVMWQNHLLPAYLVMEKADNDVGARGLYNRQLNLIEENLAFIEKGYQGNIELQQLQMIKHLENVRDSLKPPAIDQNLDLSDVDPKAGRR